MVGLGGYSVNRALAKTVTFRTFATTTDFATNYAVVRDLPQAAMLTAFGFFVGPFVYLGHEMAWDLFGRGGKARDGRAASHGSGVSRQIAGAIPRPFLQRGATASDRLRIRDLM